MGDFLRSALGYFGSSGPSKPENELVGQYIEVGNQSFHVKSIIAEGGFAIVFEAQDTKDGKEYALKRLLSQDEETSKSVLHEINILKQLSGHPNIVQFISAASVGRERARHVGSEFLIVTELCKGGQLIDLMRSRGRPFPVDTVLQIIHQTSKAVQHMHKQSPPIIHRDLKIENLLLSSKNIIKLCDFGSATTEAQYPDLNWTALMRGQVQEEMEKNTTPMYRSPEMLDLYLNYPINESADIWALGCVLFYLCYHVHPFEDSAKLAILNANYNLPSSDSEYGTFHNLIRQMLLIDPRERPQINAVVGELSELASAQEIRVSGPISWDEETRRRLAAYATPPVEATVPTRPSAPPPQRPPPPSAATTSPPPRPPPPSQTQSPPPASSAGSQQAGAQAGSGMLGFLRGGAGNLMRNIRDASSKVMETVSATMRSDLDFNYITTRVAVMSFPAEGGLETIARNHIEDVQAFLDTRHPRQYAVYNLTTRSYRGDRFDGRVSHRGFDPTWAPPLRVLLELCINMHLWLSQSRSNVCVIHCLDGKAGSASVTCAFLCFCRLFDQAQPAIQLFCARRCNPALTPSQIRYINYVCQIVNVQPQLPHYRPVLMVAVTLSPVPAFNKMKNGCRPYVEVYQSERRIYSTLQEYEAMRSYTLEEKEIMIPLNGISATGDVTIVVYHTRSSFAGKGKISSLKICQFQFYSGFVEPEITRLSFARHELDHLDLPDKYSENFSASVELIVSPQEKPRQGDSLVFPWESLPARATLNKRVLFHEREEMENVLQDYGRYNRTSRQTASEDDHSSGSGSCEVTPDHHPRPAHAAAPAVGRLSQSTPPPSAPAAEETRASTPILTDNFFETLSWGGKGGRAQAEEPVQVADLLGFTEDSGTTAGATTTEATCNQKPEQLVGDDDDFVLLDIGRGSAGASSNIDFLSGGVPQMEDDPWVGAGTATATTPAPGVADSFDLFGGQEETAGAATAPTSAPPPLPRNSDLLFDPFSGGGMAGTTFLQPTLSTSSSSNNLLGQQQSASEGLRNSSSFSSLAGAGMSKSGQQQGSRPLDPFADLGNLFVGGGQQQRPSPGPSPQHKSTEKPPMGSGYQFGGGNINAPPQQAPTRPSPEKSAPNYNRANFANPPQNNGTATRPNLGKNAFSDLLGGFGPGNGSGIGGGEQQPKTIKEMRKELMVKETDPEKLKVQEWVEGKERNIRALLCSLSVMIWEGVRWKPTNMAELVTTEQVKKQYKNAARAIHPDKWMGTEYENISRLILIELNDAMTELEKAASSAATAGGPGSQMRQSPF